MKFAKLTELNFKFNHEKKEYDITEKGPVFVNLDRVCYINTNARNDATELTFMDYEDASCCVSVKESINEIIERWCK